jgi:murein DD-endopeptidase MepM/ murein hydrolase activator NlpD
MGPAGDDGVVDPQPHPDAGDGGRGSFDPGLETGYLRGAPRDHELEPELGAAPFDPGPQRYDDRRARRAAKRRQRTDRKQRDRQPSERSRDPEASTSGPARLTLAPGSADPAETAPVAVPPPAEAEVIDLPRREPMAERLERERVGRERKERKRREQVERKRAAREQAERKRLEQRQRERAEKLRRDQKESHKADARIDPGVTGPVKKRARAAENRRRVAARRRGLFWPTAKAGLAVTLVLALGGALGSVLGLPVPGIGQGTGETTLASSASLFGIDPGTPTGLVRGYVFPLRGPHDFGDKIAGFGAPRSGHIHEGQDIFGKTGTPEVAVHDGIVVDRGKTTDPDDGGRGNYIAIYSPPDNHSFVYMHMLKPSPVQLGDKVHSGDVVGQLGCTGSCDGPHLHFEVRIGKASLGADTKAINPLPFLKQWPQSTPG